MKHLDGLLKLVDNEFAAIEQNGKFRSREEIDSVYKLVDIAKDVYCIWNYEDEMDGGESYDDGSYRSYRGSYDDGMAYARGRGRNAKRDSMGRYARDGGSYRGRSYDGGSYRGYGYSRDDGKQEYIENLRHMMEEAPDDNTRQSIQRMLSQMENS